MLQIIKVGLPKTTAKYRHYGIYSFIFPILHKSIFQFSSFNAKT